MNPSETSVGSVLKLFVTSSRDGFVICKAGISGLGARHFQAWRDSSARDSNFREILGP